MFNSIQKFFSFCGDVLADFWAGFLLMIGLPPEDCLCESAESMTYCGICRIDPADMQHEHSSEISDECLRKILEGIEKDGPLLEAMELLEKHCNPQAAFFPEDSRFVLLDAGLNAFGLNRWRKLRMYETLLELVRQQEQESARMELAGNGIGTAN